MSIPLPIPPLSQQTRRQHGLQTTGAFAAVFAAVQAAVAALIVRAVHRIGGHVLSDPWLWTIAIIAMVAQLFGVHFAITLIAGGIAHDPLEKVDFKSKFVIPLVVAGAALAGYIFGLTSL